MQINSDHPITTQPTKCVNCGAEERRLLHHVRHRGAFRRLCTNCVLRFNAQSFCPTCFQVYPPYPSNDAVAPCTKCYSNSHSHCVPSPYQTPYVCPLCANPNVPVFQLKPPREDTVDISGNEEWRVMDRDAAKKLLAAAKIAASTMTKAAATAKLEAEKKAMEAAFARKRAREALEHVRNLAEKEKMKKRENNGSFAYRHSVSNGAGPPSFVENVGRVGNSNQVMYGMNGVELRENKASGSSAGIMDVGGIVEDDDDDDDVVIMDVDLDVDVDIDVDVDGSGVGGSGVERDHGMVANGENGAGNVKQNQLGNGEVPRTNGTH